MRYTLRSVTFLFLGLFGLLLLTRGDAASSPIAYFPAEGTPTDICQAHHDATVPAVVSQHYAPGKVGQAFHFDGSLNYVDFSDWFAFQSFSVGMWIRDNATAGSPQVDGAGVAENRGDFGLIWRLSYQASNNSYNYQSGDGGSPITFSLPSGSWHYLVITRDGASRSTKIYVDGTLVGSAQGTGDVDYDFITGMRWGADRNLTKYWKGDIDEVRFYDRSLGDAELALLARAGTDVVVNGPSNPYLAGMAAGATDNGYDGVPDQSPVAVTGLPLAAGQRLRFSVAGSVFYSAGTPTDAPDGSSSASHGPSNGIAGVTYPPNALVAVFLGAASPADSAAPTDLNVFSVAGGLDYTTLSPELKQVFFIGDGLTAANALQDVVVPAGATRLFLGTSDGAGWYNNAGSFSVHVVNLDAVGGGSEPLSPTTLTINGNATPSTVAQGASIHFVATQSSTASGLFVRVQAIATPEVEGSWTDLNDGNSGRLQAGANAGEFTLDSVAYPIGNAIYFRAISSATGLSDSVSNVVGPFELHQAPSPLAIALSVSSSSDPHGHAVRIGDQLTYTLTFINGGSTQAKNLRVRMLVPHFRKTSALDSTNTEHQFATANLSISPGGSVVETGDTAPDGTPERAIVWDVGNLDPTFQQFVTFIVNVTNEVKVPSTITFNNNYSVASTTAEPAGVADALSSGATPVSIDVRGPIKLTAVPDVTKVAPGGLFSYTFTLTNLGGTFAKYPAIVIDVPEFSRFVSAGYVDRKGKVVKTLDGGHAALEIDLANGPNQILLLAGKLNPQASVKVRITFQAQWADPADVPKISTLDYAAGFINPVDTAAVRNFLRGDGVNDFMALVLDQDKTVASTLNDSGIVELPFAGDLKHAPRLGLIKAIADNKAMTLDDINTEDEGDGDLLNTVIPGNEVTFFLGAVNTGDSPAEDVYIQDRLPEGTVLVTPGAKPKVLTSGSSAADLKKAVSLAVNTKSGTKSKGTLNVTLDPDQRTLRIGGLHLEPKDSIGVSFTVQVKESGSNAPAVGAILHAGASTLGSSSTPHTPAGIPGDIPIKIVGEVAFTTGLPQPLVPRPGVSSDVGATADTLTAIFKADADALPLQPNTNPAVVKSTVPGFQRYYLHYANTGRTAATDVTLRWPIPAHTVFYRTAYLDKNGAFANKKDKFVPAPNGVTVTAPAFLSEGGMLSLHFNRLNAGQEGDFMVEVIVRDTAVSTTGSQVVAVQPAIQVGSGTATTRGFAERDSSSLFFTPGVTIISPLGDLLRVPQVGIMKVAPVRVSPGETFTVQLVVFNYGDIDAHPIAEMVIPEGTTFVSASAGQSLVLLPASPGPGNVIDAVLASNNGPITQDSIAPLKAHTAAALTITLKATGALGTSIQDSSAAVVCDYVGRVNAMPTATQIAAPPLLSFLFNPNATIKAVTGPNFLNLDSGAVLIGLGGGNIVAAGAGNIVAAGAGNIVAQGAGNIVAQGAGNLITINGVANLGNISGAAVLANIPSIVAQGAGNLWNGGATNLISNDGASLISNDGGSLKVGDISAMLANHVSSIVAAGAGNIVAQGAGNIVAQGAGNIVAAGAGNIITFGGGIVAQGAGNIVAQGAGNIVASGAGNIALSLSSSSAIVAAGAGNIVAAGGGNIVAQGAGN
ncbi:LamG-like jellyroll fold domain-containing protein [Verrucomicrobiota bacterium sgz303538]